MNNVKQFLKKIPIVRLFIYTFLHPHIKTKKILKNIEKYFFNISDSVKKFDQIPKIPNLIISLTSFPARMKFIEYTIFSLIQQNIRPEKIILWLSEKEFLNKESDIPDNIKKYSAFGLEIKFVKENFKSYKKLIFSLKEYPDYIIVTADDDIFYKPDWLEILYYTHKLFPNDVISNKVRRITFSDKKINPYLMWKYHKNSVSYLNFLIGYGGVLYPPHCLYKDVFEDSIFMKLCPYADDIWFYIMALLSNTKIRKPKYYFKKNLPFDYEFTKEWENVPELIKINLIDNKNDIQFKAVLNYYNLYEDFYTKYA